VQYSGAISVMIVVYYINIDNMKRIIPTLSALVLISLSIISCAYEEQKESVSMGTVTVKNAADGACHLQIEDNTVLIPTNTALKSNPFGRQVRAFIQFTDKGVINYAGLPGITYRSADIHFIDSILTKEPVQTTGNDDEKFGTDPIEIYNSWMTSIEDGYITIHFAALWGHLGKVHYINLIKGTTDDPLTFELRHNAQDDIPDYRGDGIVAFNISNLLDPARSSYEITINYQGFSTTKSIHCTYVPGSSTSMANYSATYQLVNETYR